MVLDTHAYREKLRSKSPRVSLVPLIDVVFTLLIFVIVTSSFQVAADSSSAGGKPEVSPSQGPSDYYLIPVAGLRKVTVNGVDMSSYIRNNAIAVHTDVIDQGEISIKPKEGLIAITTPPGIAPDKAVGIPQ
jgi:biopolymer transport protein ExbD